MIDTVIEDRFKIKERLVLQGMIEIFEGVDLDEGQPVWIKFLGMPVAQDLEFTNNWRGQLLAVQSIHDVHLPRIISFGHSSDGQLYQIEEPPRGITLRRYTNQRVPIGVPDSIKLVVAAARAVSVAHREGIAHGGLSPESIYIEANQEQNEEQPVAFITHWEMGELMIAAHHAKQPLHGRLRPYFAPEQLSEAIPPPTPAGDVYALGAILYELFTGSLPSLNQMPASPSRFNPAISFAVEEVLLRALSREPAARQPNAQALASGLMQALQASPPPVLPPNQVQAASEPIAPPAIGRSTTPAWPIAGMMLALFMLCTCIFLMAVVSFFPWPQSQEAALSAVATATLAEPQLTATALILTVPNLKGPPYIPYNRAVEEAWNRGFRVRIVGFSEELSENAPPPGVIVDQCPEPGYQRGDEMPPCLADGRFGVVSEDMILIQVSSLPEPAVIRVVPDLYGQPEESARALLSEGGLRIGTRLPAYDLLIPPGHIIEQNPGRGIGVLPGTPIDIIVSAGLPPTEQDSLPIPPLPDSDNGVDASTSVPSPEALTALPVLNSPTPVEGANPAYPAPALSPSPVAQSPTTMPQTPTSTTATRTTLPPSRSPTAIIDGSSEIILLQDDFEEGNRLRWLIDETKSSIENGVFTVKLQEPGVFWQSQPYDSGLFDDYTYRAFVTLVDESSAREQEAEAGLLFRTQGEDGFYFFSVNGLGEFRLRVYNGGEWYEQLSWASDPSILPSGATNELEVRVEIDRIILAVNGQDVVGGIDMPPEFSFELGGIGLGVLAGTQPLSVQFDDVEVSR